MHHMLGADNESDHCERLVGYVPSTYTVLLKLASVFGFWVEKDHDDSKTPASEDKFIVIVEGCSAETASRLAQL